MLECPECGEIDKVYFERGEDGDMYFSCYHCGTKICKVKDVRENKLKKKMIMNELTVIYLA